MCEIVLFQDYYPLYKDLNDLCGCDRYGGGLEDQNSSQFNITHERESDLISRAVPDVELIIELSSASNPDPFQAMIMVVKNAFEGFVLLEWGYIPEQIFESGTLKLNIAHETAVSFTVSFRNNLEAYLPGIRSNWERIFTKNNLNCEDYCFNSIVHYILGNKIFQLPVVLFSTYSIKSFYKVTEPTRTGLEHHFLQMHASEQYLSNFRLVQFVNSTYYKRFEERLLIIDSKIEILRQLEIKKTMSMNPDISSEAELETQYFNFILESRSGEQSKKLISFTGMEAVEYGNTDFRKELWTRIKMTFRMISKNCREIHLTDQQEKVPDGLNDLFISAVEIYNDHIDNQVDTLIKYHELCDLLCKVIIHRRVAGLEMFLGRIPISHSQEGDRESPDSERYMLKKVLDERMSAMQAMNYTSFKSRNICDEELAILHESFLDKQVEHLNNSIEKMKAKIVNCLHTGKLSKIS